jgi:hypothetical protein
LIKIGHGGKKTIWGFFSPKFGQKGVDFLQWEFIDYNIASINGSKKCRQFLNTHKCREFKYLEISTLHSISSTLIEIQ